MSVSICQVFQTDANNLKFNFETSITLQKQYQITKFDKYKMFESQVIVQKTSC